MSASALIQVGEFLLVAAVIALVLVFVAVPCCSRVLGKAIKTLLQSVDKRILGVAVQFGHLWVNPCTLQVSIEGCTVENPEGYSTPFLMKMERVLVDISFRQLLWSCGQRVCVQQILLDQLEVNVEKSMWSSNVQDVLKFLGEAASPRPSPQERHSMSDSSSDTAEDLKATKKKKQKVEVHDVVVTNVSVNLQAWMFKMKLRPADLDFQDLTEEVSGHESQVLVKLLLESLLMSVLANLPAGESVNQAWNQSRRRGAASDSSDSSWFSHFSGSSGSECEGGDKPPCCAACA